jgi:hypothetical protein
LQTNPALHDPWLQGLAQTNVTSSVDTQFCDAQSVSTPQDFPSATVPGKGPGGDASLVGASSLAAESLAAAASTACVVTGPIPPAQTGAA